MIWSTVWCVGAGDWGDDTGEQSAPDDSTVLLAVLSEGGESLSIADDEDSQSALTVDDKASVVREAF